MRSCPVDGFEAARHFFSMWFISCYGLAELRYLTPDGSRQEFFDLRYLDRMAERALELGMRYEVYFGCATRKPTKDRPRGRNKDVSLLPGLWVDYDLKAFPDENGILALEHLDSFSPQPTVRVYTGGGWHLFWKLDQPLYPSREAKAMLRALCRALHGDPAATDFARVLRVPGTFSHKRQTFVRLQRCWH